MNNILGVGAGDLGTYIKFFPDSIRIMALLISWSSSIIQIFWGDAVNFEVFIKRGIPI